MLSMTARRGVGRPRRTARRAARSGSLRMLARAGFAARCVMYILIGWIAVQIAVGLYLFREASRRAFLRDLDTGRMTSRQRRLAVWPARSAAWPGHRVCGGRGLPGGSGGGAKPGEGQGHRLDPCAGIRRRRTI